MVTAALIDGGPDGRWAADLLREGRWIAPHLMPVEVANVLRRSALAGRISQDAAALAHADLLDLQVTLLGYAAFARRVWELHAAMTAYDAWYVALAEAFDTELATLDLRLTRAPGAACRFLTPRT